jgi:hypothetical protein
LQVPSCTQADEVARGHGMGMSAGTAGTPLPRTRRQGGDVETTGMARPGGGDVETGGEDGQVGVLSGVRVLLRAPQAPPVVQRDRELEASRLRLEEQPVQPREDRVVPRAWGDRLDVAYCTAARRCPRPLWPCPDDEHPDHTQTGCTHRVQSCRNLRRVARPQCMRVDAGPRVLRRRRSPWRSGTGAGACDSRGRRARRNE